MLMPDDPIPLQYAGPKTAQQQVIAVFHREADLLLAAGRLESAGIPAAVTQRATSWLMGFRSAALAVGEADVHDAIAVLFETPARRWLVEPGKN